MAKLLPMQLYPASILRQKARSFDVSRLPTAEIAELIIDMEKTMKKHNGIGLAAPQIGKSIRLAIIHTQDGILTLINPTLRRLSLRTEIMEEGCLSIPEVFGTVKRPLKIMVSAYNSSGKKIRFVAEGMLARVIQHEVDHLNGVLFIDKVLEVTQGNEKLERLKRQASL